jgi:hypothetical protein
MPIVVLNFLFWLLCLSCGFYAFFTESWQGDRGFLKGMDPRKKMLLFRVVGMVLIFFGLWMLLRNILQLPNFAP